MGSETTDCEVMFHLTNAARQKLSVEALRHTSHPWGTNCCTFGITFTAMVLALVMSSIAVMIYHQQGLKEIPHEFCLDCSLTADLSSYDEKFVVKGGQCCVLSEDGEQLLVSLIGHMLESSKTSSEYMNTRAPSPYKDSPIIEKLGSHIGAHKFLIKEYRKPMALPDFSSPFVMKLNTQDKYQEYSYGVKILADGIEVTQPGLYYVYMSVYFKPASSHPCRDFTTQTFNGTLLRKNPGRQKAEPLLKTIHTCCPTCVLDRQSSFVGGVFYLRKGEQLRVQVLARDIVYMSPDSHFMGLSLLNIQNNPTATRNTTPRE